MSIVSIKIYKYRKMICEFHLLHLELNKMTPAPKRGLREVRRPALGPEVKMNKGSLTRPG
jgi:hypothetical protein